MLGKNVLSRSSVGAPTDVGKLMRDIAKCRGTVEVRCALQLAPYVFVRPDELLLAEWAEINFEAAEWHIPPHRTKDGRARVVPLSAQSLAVLCELQLGTGSGQHLFPEAARARSSKSRISLALEELGYTRDQISLYDFRKMAETLLGQQGWHAEVIQGQLGNSARMGRAVYKVADYLPERRKMMQAWGDYLDALRDERKVSAIPSRKRVGVTQPAGGIAPG